MMAVTPRAHVVVTNVLSRDTQPSIREPKHFFCIIAAEIDRLANVGICLGPSLARLKDLQSREFKAALPQQFASTLKDFCSLLGGVFDQAGAAEAAMATAVSTSSLPAASTRPTISSGFAGFRETITSRDRPLALPRRSGCKLPNIFAISRSPFLIRSRSSAREKSACGSFLNSGSRHSDGRWWIVAGSRRRISGEAPSAESRAQKSLIGSILKKAPHEIRHSGKHFTQRAVFANAITEFDQRLFDGLRHAVEHLELQARLTENRFVVHWRYKRRSCARYGCQMRRR